MTASPKAVMATTGTRIMPLAITDGRRQAPPAERAVASITKFLPIGPRPARTHATTASPAASLAKNGPRVWSTGQVLIPIEPDTDSAGDQFAEAADAQAPNAGHTALNTQVRHAARITAGYNPVFIWELRVTRGAIPMGEVRATRRDAQRVSPCWMTL
jgi:hypothetical protein